MADQKISALPASTTPLAGTEVLPIVQSAATKKVSVADLTAGRTVNALNVVATRAASAANWVLQGKTTGVSNDSGLFVDSSNNMELAARNGAGVLKVRIGASGNSWIDAGNLSLGTGNLVVGTAGKGIDFSANTHAAGMTSELLNWYEEGTWTPAIQGSTGSAGSYNASVAVGSYTRIGNTVFVQGRIVLTDKGSWTGSARMTGLPFTATSTGSNFAVGSPASDNVTFGAGYTNLITFVAPNTNYFSFNVIGSGVPSGDLLMTGVANNTGFLFSGVYKV